MASGASWAEDAAEPASDVARAHAAVRGDRSIQFEFPAPEPEPPPPSGDYRWLAELIEALAPIVQLLFWAALAAAAAGLLWFIGREVIRSRWPERRKPLVLQKDDWRPDQAAARVLLEDADRLAVEGRFAEAAHLLLRRSVQDIQQSRPGLVRPALTSRDIAGHDQLPSAARAAFSAIARVVERGRFAARPVGPDGWSEARSAYAEFALSGARA
jgi:hypothetical protein